MKIRNFFFKLITSANFQDHGVKLMAIFCQFNPQHVVSERNRSDHEKYDCPDRLWAPGQPRPKYNDLDIWSSLPFFFLAKKIIFSLKINMIPLSTRHFSPPKMPWIPLKTRLKPCWNCAIPLPPTVFHAHTLVHVLILSLYLFFCSPCIIFLFFPGKSIFLYFSVNSFFFLNFWVELPDFLFFCSFSAIFLLSLSTSYHSYHFAINFFQNLLLINFCFRKCREPERRPFSKSSFLVIRASEKRRWWINMWIADSVISIRLVCDKVIKRDFFFYFRKNFLFWFFLFEKNYFEIRNL